MRMTRTNIGTVVSPKTTACNGVVASSSLTAGADQLTRDGQRRRKNRIGESGRSGRVVYGSGFENRRSRKGTRGSNPFSSANAVLLA